MCTLFNRKQPCNDCPYRLDAPLKKWHISEFNKLLIQDEQFGAVFQCHKKDGHVCVGWLMKQDENNMPNINLRMMLSKNQVTVEYLDSLECKAGLYDSVEDMIKANYPQLLKRKSWILRKG